LLVTVALLLAVGIKSLIIGEAASSELRPSVETIVAEELRGARVLRFLAIQIAASEVLVGYKVHPGDAIDVRELIEGINPAEKRVKLEHPEVRWQFVEPDYEA
jgi:hypothetical protein